MDKEVVELYLDDIIPNRFQPREIFNPEALQELARSIRVHGVIQPIIVRKIGDKYEIIAGERRYKASILAGLTKIPAIIRNLDDKEASKVALLENLQRRDLSAIEEARTYQKILELDNMTQEELGRTMGKSQAAIANKMRLLTLPDEVQEAVLNEKISERHARSLLNLTLPEDQIKMLNVIINNRLTVRELDTEIQNMKKIPNYEPKIIEQVGPKIEIEDNASRVKLIDDEEIDFSFNNGKDIEELEPVEENKQKQEKEYKLNDVVSSIKTNIDKMKEKGYYIRTSEDEQDDCYEIIIKIEKKPKK